MIKIDDNTRMIITDDAGNEKEVAILLTFESKDLGKQYVIFCDPDDDQQVYVCAYDDEGNLMDVEDEKELEYAQEVWEAFQDDSEEED
jgi:uncharacterized protein YrzB (UPF0473 family)